MQVPLPLPLLGVESQELLAPQVKESLSLEQHLQQQLALEQLEQKGLCHLLENGISSWFGRCNQFEFLDCTRARSLSIFAEISRYIGKLVTRPLL